jgi:hypothetical protein
MTGRLPNFIIIGAQKSAIGWLRDVLASHPDIFAAPRELEFFNHHFDKGLAWYSSHFAGAHTLRAVGEATPGYMMLTDNPGRSAARIDGSLPGARLIALLRNPVDRMCSAFTDHARMGRLDGVRSLTEHVREVDPVADRMGLVSGGWYARSLLPYIRRFGGQLLVVLQDDVQDRPDYVYSRVVEHIGADPWYRPEGLGQIRHSNRDAVGDDVLTAVRLTRSERADLYERFFADDVAQLVELTGVDVSRWRPKLGQVTGPSSDQPEHDDSM